MPSIINGLFAARSGISSHGNAIAVVGDNISNASTIGYKASRAEFSDLIAGGQAAGKVVGSGSTTSAVSAIFTQGTVEFTGRAMDLAIDGNGFFVVANGTERYYTRAGNFKVDDAGYIVDQNGYAVLGYPNNGTGALEPININTVSQDSVGTTEITVSGNLNASSTKYPVASIPAVPAAGAASNGTSYSDLAAVSDFQSVVKVFDSLGSPHNVNLFYFHSSGGANQYVVRAYVDDTDVSTGGAGTGEPRQVGSFTMNFASDGTRNPLPTPGTPDLTLNLPWTNGSSTSSVDLTLAPFTQFSAASNILSVTQDGKGIGTVGNVSIGGDGKINALLSNGQSATVGTIGMATFSNQEGLTRIGKNLMIQSPTSGEPIEGKPASGTFGTVSSGSLELSTVDIANEFVKLIQLQRGFQANSRIITTINQLLNDIIQLA